MRQSLFISVHENSYSKIYLVQIKKKRTSTRPNVRAGVHVRAESDIKLKINVFFVAGVRIRSSDPFKFRHLCRSQLSCGQGPLSLLVARERSNVCIYFRHQLK